MAATVLSPLPRWRNPDGRCALLCWAMSKRLRGDAQFHRASLARRHRTADARRSSMAPSWSIDALFGSGLESPLWTRRSAMSWRFATRRALPIVAVDIPSGILGDSGENLGRGAPPSARSHSCAKNPDTCCCRGATCAAMSWLPISAYPQERAQLVGHRYVGERRRHCGLRNCRNGMRNINKYSRGHALLYGGYPMTGAARMAARAAARIGAGLTTIAVPEHAFAIYAAALTSIMVAAAGAGRRLRAAACRIRDTRHFRSDPARASAMRRVPARWTC